MDRRVHLLGERAHNMEVVPLDKDMEVVYIKVMVLCMVHMVHIVGVVDKGLVSMVVQRYVEEVVHKHMVGLVGNYKGVHHIYQLGMHCKMVFVHDILEDVVA